MNKRDVERQNRREKRELLKLSLKSKMDEVVVNDLSEISRSRVSCNLNSNLADELIRYVKREDVKFTSRTKLIEHIVEEWAKNNENILSTNH